MPFNDDDEPGCIDFILVTLSLTRLERLNRSLWEPGEKVELDLKTQSVFKSSNKSFLGGKARDWQKSPAA